MGLSVKIIKAKNNHEYVMVQSNSYNTREYGIKNGSIMRLHTEEDKDNVEEAIWLLYDKAIYNSKGIEDDVTIIIDDLSGSRIDLVDRRGSVRKYYRK